MIPLIGVGFYPNSPTSFEIRRGASKILLQAPDTAARDEWLKHLQEGQVDVSVTKISNPTICKKS
jgi:hypothetical protein